MRRIRGGGGGYDERDSGGQHENGSHFTVEEYNTG